jgi:hypothetical protein
MKKTFRFAYHRTGELFFVLLKVKFEFYLFVFAEVDCLVWTTLFFFIKIKTF